MAATPYAIHMCLRPPHRVAKNATNTALQKQNEVRRDPLRGKAWGTGFWSPSAGNAVRVRTLRKRLEILAGEGSSAEGDRGGAFYAEQLQHRSGQRSLSDAIPMLLGTP